MVVQLNAKHDNQDMNLDYRKRKIKYGIIGGIICSFFGLICGLLIGSTIGGNHFVNYEFAGNRGYEATGILGAIIGLPIGLLIGVLLGIIAAYLIENKITK